MNNISKRKNPSAGSPPQTTFKIVSLKIKAKDVKPPFAPRLRCWGGGGWVGGMVVESPHPSHGAKILNHDTSPV